MHSLAHAYHYLGRTAKAARLFEDVVGGRREVLGANSPDTLTSLNSLANVYYCLHQRIEAISLLETVVKSRTRVCGRTHPDTVESKELLARVYYDSGQWFGGLKAKCFRREAEKGRRARRPSLV